MTCLYLCLKASEAWITQVEKESLQLGQKESNALIIRSGKVIDFVKFEELIQSYLDSLPKRKWLTKTKLKVKVGIPYTYTYSDKYILMNSLSRLGFAEIELRYNNLIFQSEKTERQGRSILIDISDYQSCISVINNQKLEAFYPLFIGVKSFKGISTPPYFFWPDWIKEKLNAHDLSRATIILIGEEVTYLQLEQELNFKMELESAFMKCCLLGLQD